MRIKNTHIKIIHDAKQKDGLINLAALGRSREKEQEDVRRKTAKALKRSQKILALPVLENCREDSLTAGVAKIMIQEVLKVLRESQRSFKEIIFCLSDPKSFKIFNEIIPRYVKHLQDDLGWGPYVTVDIIIEMDAGIILIERSNPPYGWALPGGFLDYGESLEETAVREAKEETNLSLVKLRQFHTYSKPGRDPRFDTVSTVFIAQGKGTARSGDDAKALKIVPFNNLLNLQYAFDHKEIIADYLKQKMS